MVHQNITSNIIKAAYKVYHKLGNGFLESIYKNSMLIECKRLGLEAKSELPLTVYYDEYDVGEFKVDIMVNDLVLVELKAVSHMKDIHLAQTIHYLKATKVDVGLLINFGQENLYVKRVIR